MPAYISNIIMFHSRRSERQIVFIHQRKFCVASFCINLKSEHIFSLRWLWSWFPLFYSLENTRLQLSKMQWSEHCRGNIFCCGKLERWVIDTSLNKFYFNRVFRIPNELFSIKTLTALRVHNSPNLKGSIPKSISDLSSLV